jgi:hypothetical protein
VLAELFADQNPIFGCLQDFFYLRLLISILSIDDFSNFVRRETRFSSGFEESLCDFKVLKANFSKLKFLSKNFDVSFDINFADELEFFLGKWLLRLRPGHPVDLVIIYFKTVREGQSMINRYQEELFHLFLTVHVLSFDANQNIFVISVAIKDSKIQNCDFMDFFSGEHTIAIVATIIVVRLKQLQTSVLNSSMVFIVMQCFLSGFLINLVSF